ncbi:polysaccharide deacetylase family protein [Lysinibacillus sp. LZ02]|uniref:polysaccharide deacetylase family protein n=1 Tax=Lysinibacillus sp. LZ02 TaxID=3420668 RepID=UPI003D35CB73
MRVIKRIKWAGWVALILFSAVTLGAIYHLVSPEIEASSGTNQITEKEEKRQDFSEDASLNVRTETKETNTYTMSISMPTLKSKSLDTPIKEWIEQQKSVFIEEVERNNAVLSADNLAYLTIDLKVETAGELYSLLFTSYQYVGKGQPTQVFKTFTVNMRTGESVQLHDIIHLNDQTSGTIRTLIKDQLMGREEWKDYVREDVLNEKLSDLDDLKWSVNKQALDIFFDQYEVAAGSVGGIEMKIPLEALRSYLNPTLLNNAQLEHMTSIEKSQLDPNGKYIALTFDDGPSPKVTPRILQTLKQHGAKATFFMLGKQVETYPQIAAQVANDGHEIANHSYGHPKLTKMTSQEMIKEMSEANTKIEMATGIEPVLFRPPYGAYNSDVVHYAKMNDYSMILWSVDSLDWKSRNSAAINDIVTNNVTNGSIVLMHDIHASTAEALPELLVKLKAEGYQFVTVSELLMLQNENGAGPHFGHVS